MEYNIGLIGVYVLLIVVNVYIGIVANSREVYIKTIFNRYKLETILAFALITFLAIIAIIDQDSPDYQNYYRMYTYGFSGADPIYNYLEEISRNCGLTYQQFKGCIITISCLLIWIGIRRLDCNANMVIALYAIFPFSYDATQLRNLLSLSVIVLSIPWIINNNIKYGGGIAKFIVAVVIASGIHVLSIVYLGLLLTQWNGKNKGRQRILAVMFFVSLLLLGATKISGVISSQLITMFSNIAGYQKASYYSRSVSQWGFLIYVLMETCYIGSSWYAAKENEGRLRNMIQSIFWMNIAVSCFFPLLAINIEFYRIFRNLAIINYIIPGCMYHGAKETNSITFKTKLLFWLGFFMNVIGHYVMTNSEVFWAFFN